MYHAWRHSVFLSALPSFTACLLAMHVKCEHTQQALSASNCESAAKCTLLARSAACSFPSRVGSTSWLELQLLWTLSLRKPSSSVCNSGPARCHRQTDKYLQLPKLAVVLFVFYASHLPAATLHPDAAPFQPRIASHCDVQYVLKLAWVWCHSGHGQVMCNIAACGFA